MEISFNGKRALVTGASQGIGRDIAKQLALCGAEVIAVSRSVDLLASLLQEIPSIKVIAVDLSNWNGTKEILGNIGPIDLLVNNAGLAILEPLTEVTEEHVDQLLAINVKAKGKFPEPSLTYHLKHLWLGLKTIPYIALGLEDHTVYCATKGAVDAYTRAAALELGPHGIRVNSVNPTVIMTAMGRLGWSDPTKANPMLQRIPLRRFGEVNEVVDAVLYLLSDRASMITGTCLPVDGGFLAG
ncbi:hypothetical protein QE152_g29454 [Popillia japonica]|uniref:L-xylulose reductase n=1 Tax=Popillia japonica TaxID=7064 RepID=A0AAW1JI02_POPJA